MNTIFVFGSNLAGRHGAGAAKYAVEHYGAQYGVGVGPTGNAYAIPTKDENLEVLPLRVITKYIYVFGMYATVMPNETFRVTRIGCGLAGYKDSVIAPFFANCPPNCHFDIMWKPYLDKGFEYFRF